MKKITIYYPNLVNMGDKLNIYILTKIFGMKAVRRTPITCKISCIGSGLGLFCLTPNPLINVMERVSGRFLPTVYVWGTGFIRDSTYGPFYRKNINFCALRGELSKKKVEEITGKKLGEIPLCDGGILASKLLNQKPEKKYAIGIIPHFRQHDIKAFSILKKKLDNSIIIDVSEDPLKVIADIASCETIISSSLHGLIVADSFHIPNLHLKITQGMRGDGFKFDDYYSSFGIKHFYIGVDEPVTPKFIKEKYAISPETIEIKKEEMIQAFPFRNYD